MPSTRSGASYKPSSRSKKGHRRDYGRSQSETEGQRSVKDFHNNKLSNSDADETILTSKRADTATRSSVEIYKASHKAYNNVLQHKEYQILGDLWKNCMNSYLTVRKLLGHPNTFKVLNGWHPLMEKKNMMLLLKNGGKKPTTTKESAKTSPSGQQKQFQCEKTATSSNKMAKGRHQPQILTVKATGFQRFSRMPWKMCFRWPEPLWNYRRRRKPD
ncbi:hypothetical protein O181_123095 [Austropuccinia psidii MF-1]|uniref:Uncharacterized protein n=1 Tax=Austropuccinia psidii MF-1 TaxID=1389203 RepID=A0A9Q3KKJ7_9BASI|nr:hypothetical protein [Austropuccinia psidii MF-1]